MQNNNPADKIFELLDSEGLSQPYVRSLLPSWWDDQAAENPAGLSEFKLALSRNLGVSLEGLSSDVPKVEFNLPHIRKLKRSVRYDESQLTPAVSVSISAARVAISACPNDYKELPDPAKLRSTLFNNYNAKYISLRGLLKLCWDHGIPVIHISAFPDGMPKMDGLVVMIQGRPAIVLSRIVKFSSWMAFILAHEMGHLANNHCRNGEMIVDESLSESSIGGTEDNLDKEEKEADEYALKLLSASEDYLPLFDNAQGPLEMARTAMQIQERSAVDAGHSILSYAFRSKQWQKSIAALTVIDKSNRAISDVLQAMQHEIDSELISDSSLAFLFKVCKVRAT